jgi:hypothetical protein
MICVDSDIGSAVPGAAQVSMYICEDSSCTRATSVPGFLNFNAVDRCQEFMGGDSNGYDSFNVGGSWVYVDVTIAPANEETLVIWVTGN